MSRRESCERAPKISIFEFEPSDYADAYAANGYVHIPGGASPEFMRYALHFAKTSLDAEADAGLCAWQITGKKQQFLMEFPENSDFPEGLHRSVETVAGLDVDRVTLSERHIKIYDLHAAASPPPHKGRMASEVTVGIGLRIPEASRVVLYPDRDRAMNLHQSTKEWRDSLDEADLPENALEGTEPVEIDMRDGDVVMFAGNSICHERTRPAGAWLLYMKLNAMRLDPICEDPRTRPQRKLSLELLHARSDSELLDTEIEISPRLEKVSRNYTRMSWKEIVQGHIAGEKPFGLSETEFTALRVLEDRRISVRELIARMGYPRETAAAFAPMLRRLIEVGAMDLLGPGC